MSKTTKSAVDGSARLENTPTIVVGNCFTDFGRDLKRLADISLVRIWFILKENLYTKIDSSSYKIGRDI